MIESLPVKGGLRAKVLFQLQSESTLAMVAIPSALWGYLEFHPAFMLIGRIRGDEPLLKAGPTSPISNPVILRNPHDALLGDERATSQSVAFQVLHGRSLG